MTEEEIVERVKANGVMTVEDATDLQLLGIRVVKAIMNSCNFDVSAAYFAIGQGMFVYKDLLIMIEKAKGMNK